MLIIIRKKYRIDLDSRLVPMPTPITASSYIRVIVALICFAHAKQSKTKQKKKSQMTLGKSGHLARRGNART